MNTRLGACLALLNKLNFFWKKSNCPPRFKLNVFDAVIRSKLVYSLESVNLTPALVSKLNAVQYRGLRKILGIEHTYINRSNTNVRIIQQANQILNPHNKPNRSIRLFGDYVHTRQEALLKHTVRASGLDPLREAMLRYNSPTPLQPATRRVGRPKTLWAHAVYERIWTKSGLGDANGFVANTDSCIRQLGEAISIRSI